VARESPMSEQTVVPTLLTERLALRAVTEADMDAYQRHFVDYEVIRHLSARVPWPYPEAGIADFIRGEILPEQGRDRWVWGLHVRENDSGLIGVVDLLAAGQPGAQGLLARTAVLGAGIHDGSRHQRHRLRVRRTGVRSPHFVQRRRQPAFARDIKARTGARLVGVTPQKFVDPAYTHTEIWRLTKAEWRQWRRSNVMPRHAK
jgi:[ribosomal protein S5]-alanine N-acetyltransferase